MAQELRREQKALKTLIIETIGSGLVELAPVDIYALAAQIHAILPHQPVEEIELEIAEVAMGEVSRAMLRDRLNR
jgi:hypothetical protein